MRRLPMLRGAALALVLMLGVWGAVAPARADDGFPPGHNPCYPAVKCEPPPCNPAVVNCSHSVPEPGTLLLLGVGGVAALVRRRK